MDNKDLRQSPVESTANSDQLLKRLENWVCERKKNIDERTSRREIASAIKIDLNREKLGAKLSAKEVIDLVTRRVKQIEKDGRTEIESVVNRDSEVMEEQFKSRVIKTEQGWVAQEINGQGQVFTEAKILKDGNTELTLKASSDRYQQLEADPDIQSRTDLPLATTKVFNTLVGATLGWNPTIKERIHYAVRKVTRR